MGSLHSLDGTLTSSRARTHKHTRAQMHPEGNKMQVYFNIRTLRVCAFVGLRHFYVFPCVRSKGEDTWSESDAFRCPVSRLRLGQTDCVSSSRPVCSSQKPRAGHWALCGVPVSVPGLTTHGSFSQDSRQRSVSPDGSPGRAAASHTPGIFLVSSKRTFQNLRRPQDAMHGPA